MFDAIQAEPGLELMLVVAGAHLSPALGLTVNEIEADRRNIGARVEMPLDDDTGTSCAIAMGRGTIGFAQAYAQLRPDILLVLGDRYEMHAAAAAAVPMNIPMAHIHGGELTFGAIDDSFRHSITKMAHLHFVTTKDYGRRVIAMGEEPWRVTVSGAPSLDKLARQKLPDRQAIEQRFSIPLDPAPLLVTYHPETRQQIAGYGIEELLAALAGTDRPMVFSAPNADPGQQAVRTAIDAFMRGRANAYFVENFGYEYYFGMLASAAAMVGNSSSGLVEAPSFRLPTVNIGDRQKGRTRAANVLDTPAERSAIAKALTTALSPDVPAQARRSGEPLWRRPRQRKDRCGVA